MFETRIDHEQSLAPASRIGCYGKLATRLVLTGTMLLAIHVPNLLAAPPAFETEVMAVFSKAGCNAGTCHGNQHGRGGFKLSLRGQDPLADYQALTREFAGRRVNLLDPPASLLLLKPTLAIAHLGGRRFRQDSPEYQVLVDWIAAGAPGPAADAAKVARLEVAPRAQVLVDPQDELQLRVEAVFTDGTRRDVTSRAVYDPSNLVVQIDHDGRVRRQSLGETTILVRFLSQQAPVQLAFIAARPNFIWDSPRTNNFIDQLVDAKLETLRINPSPLAGDEVFVRRAFLDALGVLPTADEARAFVADSHSDKRAQLIDALLMRAEFAEHWALKWSDLLRNEEKVLDAKGVDVFHAWIRDSIASGKPLDQFVRELVSSRGSTYDNPPANYYRANRDPLTRGETTARLFLGTRLQCAKCHNHPFERWTQDDYYSWAALFARVDYKIVDNQPTDKLDTHEFVGEQIVLVKDDGEVTNARTGRDAVPRFLGGQSPEFDKQTDRLARLAQWLTANDNRLFAKSQVNFVWYHLLGRGLVDPIDDFRETNPASNPQLLEALAADFVAHGFDLRQLVRTIMNSRTYQLSAVPNETNTDDQANFSRAIVRRLTAEQLLDAQSRVLDVPLTFAGYDQPLRAGEMPGVRRVKRRAGQATDSDRFLMTFGKPERLLACECERSNETTLTQAFVLVGGEGINQRLAQAGNRVERLAKSDRSDAEVVTELYWVALSRAPSATELQAAVSYVTGASDRFVSLQDVAWALLNAKEFIFRS